MDKPSHRWFDNYTGGITSHSECDVHLAYEDLETDLSVWWIKWSTQWVLMKVDEKFGTVIADYWAGLTCLKIFWFISEIWPFRRRNSEMETLNFIYLFKWIEELQSPSTILSPPTTLPEQIESHLHTFFDIHSRPSLGNIPRNWRDRIYQFHQLHKVDTKSVFNLLDDGLLLRNFLMHAVHLITPKRWCQAALSMSSVDWQDGIESESLFDACRRLIRGAYVH